jgi:hypothetical protein
MPESQRRTSHKRDQLGTVQNMRRRAKSNRATGAEDRAVIQHGGGMFDAALVQRRDAVGFRIVDAGPPSQR